MTGFKNNSRLLLIGLLVLLMHGCGNWMGPLHAPPLPLTPAEEEQVAAATEARLMQLLGGPYHDQAVAAEVKRLCLKNYPTADGCKISVADSSDPALYPLPAGRMIFSRGLLAEMTSTAELLSVLGKGVQLAGQVYETHTTRGLNESTRELLSGTVSRYAPDSADVRLARFFRAAVCEKDCLASSRVSPASPAGGAKLPDSVKRIAALRPGYELLGKARGLEQQGDEARAIATYLQAATATPDEPGILRALGMAYLRAGQLQPARLHLQKAAELQPNYYRTLMGLGYLYLQSGKIYRASQLLAESVDLLPVTENLFLLAEAREKSGDLKGASLLYKVIFDADPESKLGQSSASRLAQSTGGK